jgi:hypothetical protein
MRSRIHRPSPAMVVACLALVFAMGGTTWAVTSLPNDSVGIAQLRTGAVTNTKIGSRAVSNAKLRAAAVSGTKIAKDAVTGGDVKNGALTGADLKGNTLTGTQVAESKLGIVPSASRAGAVTGLTVLKSAHVPEASDESGAPMTALGTRGDISFYAKCFKDVDGTSTDARIYFAISPGHTAVYNTGAGGYVTASTPETDRIVQTARATAGTFDGDNSPSVFRATTGTTTITGVLGDVFAKNGTVTGGDGPFGAGNSCIVGGGGIFG